MNGSDRASAERRTDAIMRVVIVVLVAAVLGLAGLFGYRVWSDRQTEASATPAQRALQDLQARVRANPNDVALRVRLGEALAAAGLIDDAIRQFEAAIKIDPEHTGAYLDLGIVAMGEDRRKDAEGYFKKVVELTQGAEYEEVNQRREVALFHLGEINLDAKRYEEAAGYFKEALRIRRDAADTYYLLAQTYRGLGQDDAAIEQLENALYFDKNYAEPHYLWGEILLDRGDKINAAIHFRKAADLAPEVELPRAALEKLGDPDQLVDAANKKLAAGDEKAAIEDALLARAIEPGHVGAAIVHAKALAALGKTKDAVAVLKDAKKLDPKNDEVLHLLDDLGGK